MSASLVGSEMCIRDRSAWPRVRTEKTRVQDREARAPVVRGAGDVKEDQHAQHAFTGAVG
eukprot:1254798-Alexandrium_andersonii.AAC.1